MTQEQSQDLHAARGLNQQQLESIAHLADMCNEHDGLDLKLNWDNLRTRPHDATNDFLCYNEQGALIGYLPIFAFNPREAEISGMVHPAYRRRGIFRRLLDAARFECQRRGIPTILLIVEQASTAGLAFVQSLPVSHDHAEYKMVLDELKIPERYDTAVQFRSAAAADAPAMKHITASAFEMPENDVDWYTERILKDSPTRHFFVGLVGKTIVGKIDVVFEEEEAFIYGFAVAAEYQGRGYGRTILVRTMQEIQARGQQHIALEVVTQNERALGLYQSCGFRVTGCYQYYRLTL
ncbi:MAG TPA: GNAT family N-acetyltransferase [Ktedonobacteraceae bacterium]